MGIAFWAVSTLAYPLNALHRWWHARNAPIRRPDTQYRPSSSDNRCRVPAAHPALRATRHTPCTGSTKLPVRVLRHNATSSDAGRMVIAGRMADVCAELERLAACEP